MAPKPPHNRLTPPGTRTRRATQLLPRIRRPTDEIVQRGVAQISCLMRELGGHALKSDLHLHRSLRDPGRTIGPSRSGREPGMYTKEEREGILWEFHQSGMSVAEAWRRLAPFPNEWNLRRWLRMEEAGELAAREMPGRASRVRCAHGEGSPAYRAARPRPGPAARARTEGGGPAERARAAEVGLAEALAVSDVPKAPGPGPLAGEERCLAGQAAREASPAVRLADVCETLSIPKSTCLSQRVRLSRPDPEAALGARVRASFEASGGTFGSESVWADLGRGEGEPVPWGDLGGRGDPGRRLREGGAPGDARGGPRAPQGGPDAPEGEVQQLRRGVRREGGQPVPPRGRGARLPRRRARPALRRRRHRVPAGRLQGLPRRGRRLPRRLAGVPGGGVPAPRRGAGARHAREPGRRRAPDGGAPAGRARRRERGALDVAQGREPGQREVRGGSSAPSRATSSTGPTGGA